jgi:hypothetical protein
MRFPRPRGTLPPRPVPPAQTEASARPGGREAPAGGGAGAGRGLWAPGGPGISGALWQGRWPLPLKRGWCFGPCSSAPSPGGKRKRTAFPPPARDAAKKTGAARTTRGQRPTRRARSARQGRGGRWPGALGPRRARDQRGAVAGAMAPAMTAGLAVRIQIVRAPLRAGTGNACVSPARAERCHKDRCNRHKQRPAPGPAGEKRPPGAGRALAGGFGPPACMGSAWHCGRGDGPCHGNGAGGSESVDPPSPGGNRKRTAFPRPCGTVPCRSAGPGTTAGQRPTRRARSARWGAGRVLVGGFGPPSWPGISVAL